MSQAPETPTTEILYTTHAKGKLHLPMCPHLQDTVNPPEATPDQRRENAVCTWCARELSGAGRAYYENVEDGLRAFGHINDEALRLIRESLVGVEHDQVWVPASESYLGLGFGGPAVAWVGKGYVAVKGRPSTLLPWFRASGGSGGSSQEPARGDGCDIHFVERSVTGVCELCE